MIEIKRFLSIDQISEEVEDLTIKNKTTKSPCGYITCAICEYLSQEVEVTEKTFKDAKFHIISPYIEKAMNEIAKTRRLEIKKFMKVMNDSQKKSYMTDWVATFEIANYLNQVSDKMLNQQVYMFRQVSYDHPEAMEKLNY